MAISFIGAGTSATANNASVTPVAHALTQVGDYVVVVTSTRATAGATATPTGWLRVAGLANLRIYARIWQSGDAIPAFTPVSTAAGDDVIGQTFTFRGVEPDVLAAAGGRDTGTSQTNASASNIAYPAFDMPADRHAAILAVWKQSAGTAATTPSGMTEAAFTQATAGNDAIQTAKYTIQLAASDFGSGTITMTGGVAAVSQVEWIELRPAAQITAVEQDTWPPRVLVSVTGMVLGDSISIYRVIAGQRTLIRNGSSTGVTDASFLRVDAELPFGVPVSYVAVVNDGVEYATSETTYTLPGGKVAVSDAITGLAAEVIIQAWPVKRRERRATQYVVGGRNLVVTGPLAQPTSEITLFTETASSGENLAALLEGATGGVIQIRQPGGYAGIDSYLAITSVDEQRYDETNGLDDRRLWVLDATETDAWGPEMDSAGYTYEALETAYSGLTYADLENDYDTYLALAQAEL